jgi:hypothetical protein
MVKTCCWVNTTVSSNNDPSLKWNTIRLSTPPPRPTWRRSPDAMRTPSTVRSARKPWVAPSAKRTRTGAAASGRGPNSTVRRTSRPSVAALLNDITVEQEGCAPTGRLPPLGHGRLSRLSQSTARLTASAPRLASGSPSRKPNMNPPTRAPITPPSCSQERQILDPSVPGQRASLAPRH